MSYWRGQKTRIAITGDREWKEDRYAQVKRVVKAHGLGHNDVFFILGDCPTGVDAFALRACKELGLVEGHDYVVHEADWQRYGRAAGPIRNRAMLDDNPDQVWYFHDDLEHSKGTKNCVEQAERRGIIVVHAV